MCTKYLSRKRYVCVHRCVNDLLFIFIGSFSTLFFSIYHINVRLLICISYTIIDTTKIQCSLWTRAVLVVKQNICYNIVIGSCKFTQNNLFNDNEKKNVSSVQCSLILFYTPLTRRLNHCCNRTTQCKNFSFITQISVKIILCEWYHVVRLSIRIPNNKLEKTRHFLMEQSKLINRWEILYIRMGGVQSNNKSNWLRTPKT